MSIKKMSFLNYKKFKEPTELSLEGFTGRIGILGNNGSGKSSLLDIIPIALYGVEAVTGKKEHLRTQGLDKELVKIRLDFESNGKGYIIEREFKGASLTPKASIFELVQEVPTILATSAKEVSSYVEKILNMDYSTFIATVFCKQKELSRISAMQPADRRAFILKLSKVDEIDDEIKKSRELKRDSDKYLNMLMNEVSAKDNILAEIDTLNKDIKVMKAEHKGTLSKLGTFEGKAIKAESEKKEFDEKYEKYNELALEVKDSQNNLSNINKNIERLIIEQRELNKIKESLSIEGLPLLNKHKEVELKVEELDSLRPKFLEKNQLLNTINKVKADGSSAKSVVNRLSSEAKGLGFNKDDIPRLEESILVLEQELASLRELKSSKENELKNVISKSKECKLEIKKINDLFNSNSNDGEDCKCPMCKQNVSKEHTEIVENHYSKLLEELVIDYNKVNEIVSGINEDILNKNKDLNELKNNLKALRVLEKKYNDILAEYNASKQQYNLKIEEYNVLMEKYKNFEDISFDEAEYTSLKNSYKNLTNQTKTILASMELVKKLPNVEKEIESLNNSKLKESSNYDSIVEKGKALNFSKEDYAKAKTNYEKARTKYLDLKEETSVLINQINSKDVIERKYLLDKLEAIKQKEKEYNKHRELSSNFAIIEEALLNTKNDIMSKINPLINKHFSEIFKTLLNEKYDDVELDEHYNVLIYDSGEAFPLSRFSGGEQDLCNLSLRLAVSKFLAEINSGSIEFIVLDEIFASLDDDKKSALIDVLGNLKDFFKQIFVISHEDVIKSSLDYYLTVKENEYRYSEIEFQ